MLETALTPLRLPFQASLLHKSIRRFKPDVVHALRIPYEGLIALQHWQRQPVAISCWGQDFSRQTARDPLLERWVRRSLPRAMGLHVDALIDIDRAVQLGWHSHRPVLHAAGNFGVRRARVHEIVRSGPLLVVYPRGRRQYIQHDLFLSMVDAYATDERFLFHGVGLAGDPAAEALAGRIGGDRFRIFPELDSEAYLQLLRAADLVVSPSLSDGTPNSLLEAMAVGASIYATDIPSVRALLGGDERARLFATSAGPGAWVSALSGDASALMTRRANPVPHDRLPPMYDAAANVPRVRRFYEEVSEMRCATQDR